MKDLINEDWEYEHQRMLVYLQEDIEDAKKEIYPLIQPVAQVDVYDQDDILDILRNADKTRTVSRKRNSKKRVQP